MDSPQSTIPGPHTQQPSTQHPPQPVETPPPDGISTTYRNKNLPPPMHLQDAVYVLSYKGYAWPDGHQYDGILGVYARLANAKTAGTRWLGEQAGLHADGFDSASAAATYVRGWEGDEAGGVWEKAKAENGTVFLESRALRIEKCDVRMDGSFVAGGA